MISSTPEAYTQALYSAEELRDLNLPGYHGKATIEDLVDPTTDWQHILSLSIYSPNPLNPEQIDVMDAIRTENTPTHPKVVSTPTSRFTKLFAAPLLVDKARFVSESNIVNLQALNGQDSQVAASFNPNIQVIPNRDAPLTLLSHESLMRKLGIPGVEFSHRPGVKPLGTISLSKVVVGFSYAADRIEDEHALEEWEPAEGPVVTPLWEPLVLWAAAMMLDDRSKIPAETEYYRNISWIPPAQFLSGVASKHTAEMIPDLSPADEATVCPRGQCLITTSLVTQDPDLASHLGLLDPDRSYNTIQYNTTNRRNA